MADVATIYRSTKKTPDIFWNVWVCRPPAAVVVWALQGSRVTPNQVTLAALVLALVSVGLVVVLPGHLGLLAAVILFELSYVLDCADGQLARLKGTSSPVGAHLDFLMDELKAFALIAAIAIRLWLPARDPRWLLEGLAGLAVVAGAISLTTFVRRPEYAAATGATVSHGTGDYGEGFETKPSTTARRSPLALAEAVGRFIVHYPSHIWLVALVNRIDIFLHAYVLMNAAYAARAFLGITLKLGRKR